MITAIDIESFLWNEDEIGTRYRILFDQEMVLGFLEYISDFLLHPPKTNMAPEKWWLEDYFPFENVTFCRGHV